MLLPSVNENRFLHLNSIAHEDKVVVFGTTILVGQKDTGQIWYTVRQDGFEDSYLNRAEVKKHPDVSLAELCERVQEAKGIQASESMMCRELRILNLPLKKVAPRQPA